MTIPTGAQTTYPTIGNREDLSDEIWKISPTETPFFSAVEKIGTKAVKHEWQTVALDAVNTGNAQLEGDTVALDNATLTTRLGNNHQISRKAYGVSRTQQAVNPAGRGNEFDFQKLLKGQALKIDIDSILSGTNQATNAGNTTTARKTASILSWIKTNTDKGASGVDPAAADGTGTRTDGTQIAFTEVRLKNVLQKIWTAGGKPNLVMAGGFNKQAFSTFTGRSTPMEQATSRRIVAAVDAYDSDFGKLKVVPSRNIRARDVLVLETAKWAVGHLPGSAMVSEPLAKVSDTDQGFMVSEYALEARNEAASGGVFDCTSA
ncbi:head protein [Bradyrhizobium centrolobii]|uniref:Head protein n=1 Tax=Bradyrhizobium centrolobii TaxID=1505087 RepID=A0A176YHF7_9BRAD|nr:DUF5309 domain-containing protein [Bradyrhizobium centrolobii]OAF05458.1 head protein [Bradyrhizobium centrolobii]